MEIIVVQDKWKQVLIKSLIENGLSIEYISF